MSDRTWNITAGCMLSLLLCAPVAASDAVRTLATDGEGRVEFAPDLATVSFTINAEDRDADDARAKVDRAVNAMLRDLDRLLPDDSVVAQDLRLQPRYDYREGRRIFRGYEASRQVRAEVEDLTLVGRVVQVAVVDGPISVDGVHFSLRDDASARDAALQAAIADARHKADLLASGFAVTLGAPLEILHGDVAAAPMPEMAMMRSMASDAPGEFRPDQLVFTSSVRVRFEIHPQD